MEHAFGVIMAGGSGERFWPLSRQRRPKQLLRMTNHDKTMLEESIDRMASVVPSERIWVATNSLLRDTIRESATSIPKENVIGEPLRRNTSGCLAYAAAHALARLGSEAMEMVMVVTTADHQIEPDEEFTRSMRAAIRFAQANEALMTMGISPTRPETGYGYIEVPPHAEPASSTDGADIYPVAQFREKPDLDLAEEFLSTGRFYWNSGMFCWKLASFMKILDRVNLGLANAVRRMHQAMESKPDCDDKVIAIFEDLPNISIDYALMEKATGSVYVTKTNYTWDDVGSWEAISRRSPRDAMGNVAIGEPVLVDCKNVTVYNEAGEDRMAVGVIGMQDICVIATEDGLLVCPKHRVQEVREVVKALKAKNAKQV